MKRTFLKTALLALAAVGMLSTSSCEKEEQSNLPTIKDTAQNPVDPIVMDSSSVQLLNNLFSIENPNIVNYQSDTVYVINTATELLQLGANGIDLDILKYYSIVWGYILAPHTNCEVSSIDLLYDGQLYAMNVNILKGAEGYSALTEVFYWGVYPKITNQIALNVSYINE